MIAYDGSPNADRAIRYAGHFLRAEAAVVVTAWQPGGMTSARMSTLAGGMQPFVDTQLDVGVDRASKTRPSGSTNAGVVLARECD